MSEEDEKIHTDREQSEAKNPETNENVEIVENEENCIKSNSAMVLDETLGETPNEISSDVNNEILEKEPEIINQLNSVSEAEKSDQENCNENEQNDEFQNFEKQPQVADFDDFDDFGDFDQNDDFGDFGDFEKEKTDDSNFADFGSFDEPEPVKPVTQAPISLGPIWDDIEKDNETQQKDIDVDHAYFQLENNLTSKFFDCLNASALELTWKKSKFSNVVHQERPKLQIIFKQLEEERLEKLRLLEEEKLRKKAEAMSSNAKELLAKLPDITYINGIAKSS